MQLINPLLFGHRCIIQAIKVDPSNHVLYSNRSASKTSLKDYKGALEDAEKVSLHNSSADYDGHLESVAWQKELDSRAFCFDIK